MTTDTLFSERQRFPRLFLWILFIIANGASLFAVLDHLAGNKVTENPEGDAAVLFGGLVTLALSVFIMSMRLETVITKEGIRVRFYPIHIRFRRYEWTDIKKISLRQYNPLLEYGGWGIRGFGHDRALNVRGNEGIQLEFNNGKKLLIGTCKKDEAANILSTLQK